MSINEIRFCPRSGILSGQPMATLTQYENGQRKIWPVLQGCMLGERSEFVKGDNLIMFTCTRDYSS